MSIFDIVYKCKITGFKLYFCDAFFLTKKMVQKGVYRSEGFFLAWDSI